MAEPELGADDHPEQQTFLIAQGTKPSPALGVIRRSPSAVATAPALSIINFMRVQNGPPGSVITPSIATVLTMVPVQVHVGAGSGVRGGHESVVAMRWSIKRPINQAMRDVEPRLPPYLAP